MPTPAIMINFSDPLFSNPSLTKQWFEDLRLQTVPGYCIFIDIVGSTKMKQNDIFHWVTRIRHAFDNARNYLHFPPLKAIGDELMFYIEEIDLERSGYVPLQLFDGLWQVATEQERYFPGVKIGVAKCESVYPITFLQDDYDYYV